MITIEGIATILPDGTITVQAETALDLPPGEHRIVMVIEQSPVPKKKEPLKFSAYNLDLLPPDFTFRREDIYDDSR